MNNLGYNFIKTGFRDYIASRFLLNNEFFIQGVTMASSAVEKYFKAILIIYNLKRKVHLDNIKEIKKAFKKINIDLLEELDENFLKILSDAYKIRYYDNLREKFSFGFLANQLLAELDFTINLIDSRFSLKGDKSGDVLTPYQIALNNKEERLFQNNYILNKKSKKEFMERPSKFYSLLVEKNGFESEIIGDGLSAEKYNGKILNVLDISFGNKNVRQ